MSDDAQTPADQSGGASGISFISFVLSLAQAAAVHFGDLADPVSGAKDANLAAAQQMIDILALLEEKTRGNLTIEERQFLESVLFELRLRFVQATRGPAAPEEPKPRIIIP